MDHGCKFDLTGDIKTLDEASRASYGELPGTLFESPSLLSEIHSASSHIIANIMKKDESTIPESISKHGQPIHSPFDLEYGIQYHKEESSVSQDVLGKKREDWALQVNLCLVHSRFLIPQYFL